LAACTFGSNVDGGGGGADGAETSASTGVAPTTGPTLTTSDATTSGGVTTMGADAGQTSTSTGEATGVTTEASTSTETGEATDTGTDTDTGSDTGDPPPSGPFDEPAEIGELSQDDADDDDPSVRFDELEIYFNSNRSGGGEIWVSTRADPDDPWDPPELAGVLNSGADDTTPQLSADGLVMILSSNRTIAVHDLWVSTRDDLESSWSMPERFEDVSSASSEWGGLLVGDVMWTCSGRAGGEGLLDIWTYADVDLVGLTAATPVNADQLNTDGDECTMTLSDDGLELFWEHRDADGEWDVWTATRPNAGEDWDELAAAANINDPAGDRDPWLSADGHRLYFASIREGRWNLYMAER